MTGNALLALMKIVAGSVSGSFAVIGDGIDSSTDVVISFITLLTARVLSKPPDKQYPYGYGKADTIATKILSFFIFFAGLQLIITTTSKMISGEITSLPSRLAIYVTVISIAGKLALAYYQFRTGKRTGSFMLIANGKNMQNDVVISLSVLTGLIFVYVFKLAILDKIAALLVGLWILKVAYQIFMRTNIELMDGTKDCSVYNKIFKAIAKVDGVHNPHRVRVRDIGYKLMISIDIEVDGNLTLSEAHTIAHEVENAIKSEIDNVFDVTIHVEPLGDKILEKDLGISRDKL
ncbi:MAG: cation transporter [Bacteroidales bacterium]|nr:cation transporter [Bacteroidales bacterium]